MKTKILIIILIILAGLFPINLNFEKNGAFAQTAPALQNDNSALQDKISILQGQVAELQIQLNEIQKIEPKTTLVSVATPAQTNIFIKTLQRGSRGDDVKQLQEFLKKYPDIYPEGLITGYFGPLTEKAVQRFQAKFQIVSSGSPVTTGYGFVGPKTRAKLNEFYSGQPSPLVNEAKLNIRKISVQQTPDGGRIATGVISIQPLNKSNIYLVKTDADGNIIWEKNYKAGDMNVWGWGQSVRQTTDGGYIIIGVVLINSNPHIYLLKVDQKGSTQWNKTFGEYYDENGFSVQQTFDGGYFVTANTRRGIKVNEGDIHLIKTDADGNTAWDKLIDPRGQHENDYPLGAKQTSDGGFIIIEYTEDESGTGLGDTYLMKINADGNMVWRKILGNFKGYLISIDSDGGYIITSKDRDSYAIKKTKTDIDGNILWIKPVDGNVP